MSIDQGAPLAILSTETKISRPIVPWIMPNFFISTCQAVDKYVSVNFSDPFGSLPPAKHRGKIPVSYSICYGRYTMGGDCPNPVLEHVRLLITRLRLTPGNRFA